MSHDAETVAALAVGTSKVAALVAERDERGGARVIGVGVHSTAGIRKGEVTNVEGVTGSVEKAVAAAEKVCNRPIRSVFLGVGGASLEAQVGRAVIPVSRPSAGISSRDMERALSAAGMTAVPPERETIDVIPEDFAVDDGERVANPEGLHGSRLAARVLIVTARLASVQNLIKRVHQAGLTVEAYLPEPLARSPSVEGYGRVVIEKADNEGAAARFPRGSKRCRERDARLERVQYGFILEDTEHFRVGCVLPGDRFCPAS